MKYVRIVLSIGVIAFLTLGYAASQFAGGGPAVDDPVSSVKYAQAVDCPAIQWIALFFLVICIVFAFIRDPEANER